MRHNRQTHRLGRNWSKRKALLESLVMSLLKYQQIQTTLPKAKAAQRLADHVISLGKEDTLSARRQVFSYLQDHTLTSRLFKEVAPRFKKRSGGYTRILRLERRKGDGAALALLELTEKEIKVKETKKAKTKEAQKDSGPAPTRESRHAKVEELKSDQPKGPEKPEKEARFTKHTETKPEKPKMGFFKNLGKFFRNKGGG